METEDAGEAVFFFFSLIVIYRIHIYKQRGARGE